MKKLQIIEPGFIFEPQTTSIDFNGVDEVMGNENFNTLGVANTWSLMLWLRRSSAGGGLTDLLRIFVLNDASGGNLIRVESLGNAGGDPLTVLNTRPDGAIIKRFRLQSVPTGIFTYDAWHQLILTWDGTDLVPYEDGVALPGGNIQIINDGTGTMTDTARSVFIGSFSLAGPKWPGFIHSAALWDVDISSAVAEIYNGGTASTFNLRNASFNANLQHWWRLGQDSTDLGKDSARTSAPIDVNVDSANITSADIVSESPA